MFLTFAILERAGNFNPPLTIFYLYLALGTCGKGYFTFAIFWFSLCQESGSRMIARGVYSVSAVMSTVSFLTCTQVTLITA